MRLGPRHGWAAKDFTVPIRLDLVDHVGHLSEQIERIETHGGCHELHSLLGGGNGWEYDLERIDPMHSGSKGPSLLSLNRESRLPQRRPEGANRMHQLHR